jgi:hypothetical protein
MKFSFTKIINIVWISSTQDRYDSIKRAYSALGVDVFNLRSASGILTRQKVINAINEPAFANATTQQADRFAFVGSK